MTALLTFLVVTAFCYAIYHYAPNRTKDLFELERFRPLGSLTDAGFSRYEEQRQYSDLAAIHGRADEPRPKDSQTRAATDGRAGKRESKVSPTTTAQVAHLRRSPGVCRSDIQASSRKLA
ncbi:hypothetical protein [Nocardia bhagyanarayanae]|uniref:Uncharacterized protein n=1 Tax=Nocardia bhagyanarayanae TaxID=1215925 RepID=A0A543F825_9NOCA|nr:hypothetical protein [Nocardia bhagyanarayanae]TQM29984.1 hypothetical protein FB390_1598 [Nocardia bhagyanarayanae]